MIKNRRNTFLFSLILLLQSVLSYGQIDTIGIGNKKLRTDFMTEGTSQFAVWSKSEVTGRVSRLILWERKVAFAETKARKIVTITQRRLYEDSAKNTYVFTVSDRDLSQELVSYLM